MSSSSKKFRTFKMCLETGYLCRTKTDTRADGYADEQTDHIFESVARWQRVVSFSTLLSFLCDDAMLRYMRHAVTHGRPMLQLRPLKHTRKQTRGCTSVTSGPVNTGSGGATDSAEGRMLASASRGSTGA